MTFVASTPSGGRRLQQAGFTLIELMISLTIALFMLAAIVAIYVNMKATFVAQDNLAQLQDSERLALSMLTTTIQSAGYFVDPLNSTAITSLPASTVTWPSGTVAALAAGQAVVGAGNGAGTGIGSDTIAVQYQTASGDGLMNCQGQTNPATSGVKQVWINIFAINALNELTCTVGAGTAVALASNVGKMTIVYGVDTDGDANNATDTYLPGSVVAAAGLWARVHTAKITLGFVNKLSSTSSTTVLLPDVVQSINFKNNP